MVNWPSNNFSSQPIGPSQNVQRAPQGPAPAAKPGAPASSSPAQNEQPATAAESTAADTTQVRDIKQNNDPFDPTAGGVSFPGRPNTSVNSTSSTSGVSTVSSVSSLRNELDEVSPENMLMAKSFVDALESASKGFSAGVTAALEASGITAEQLTLALRQAAESLDPEAPLPQ